MPTFVGMTGRHNRRVELNAGWYNTDKIGNSVLVVRIFRGFVASW